MSSKLWSDDQPTQVDSDVESVEKKDAKDTTMVFDDEDGKTKTAKRSECGVGGAEGTVYYNEEMERSFLEDLDRAPGIMDPEMSNLDSHLDTSRYGSQITQRGHDGTQLPAPILARRRTGVRRPATVHPRHVLIFTSAFATIALSIACSILNDLQDSDLIADRPECDWSPWESERDCLCNDTLARRSRSGSCVDESVVCATAACPLEPPAAAALKCFCWDTEPCVGTVGNFVFLRRTLFKRCPAVYWPDGASYFIPCSEFPQDKHSRRTSYPFDGHDIWTCDAKALIKDAKDHPDQFLPELHDKPEGEMSL